MNYLEVRIHERRCYVTRKDLRIFYGLASHITGEEKPYAELPDDAYIIGLSWTKKVNLPKQLPGSVLP